MPASARLVAVLLALAALAGPPPAAATTVRGQSLESLADRADLVVRGTVERVEARAPESSPPFTLAFVRVAESAAGRAPAVVPVRLPGGMTADGMLCAVAGTPALGVGDEVVLFLTRVPGPAVEERTVAPPGSPPGRGVVPAGGPQPREQWQPIGLSLGAWRVVEEATGPVAVHDTRAGSLHVQGEAPGTPLPGRILVTDLLARVRERRAAGGSR